MSQSGGEGSLGVRRDFAEEDSRCGRNLRGKLWGGEAEGVERSAWLCTAPTATGSPSAVRTSTLLETGPHHHPHAESSRVTLLVLCSDVSCLRGPAWHPARGWGHRMSASWTAWVDGLWHSGGVCWIV